MLPGLICCLYSIYFCRLMTRSCLSLSLGMSRDMRACVTLSGTVPPSCWCPLMILELQSRIVTYHMLGQRRLAWPSGASHKISAEIAVVRVGDKSTVRPPRRRLHSKTTH